MKNHPLFSLLIGSLACLSATADNPRSGTIAHWNFDNQSAVDSVSGLKAVPTNGSLSLEEGFLRLDNDGKGDTRGAALIVASDPVLTGHDNGATGYNSLVLELDVRLEKAGEQVQLLRKTDANDIGYQLFIRPDGRVGFMIKTPRGTLRLTSKNKIPADGKWHHIEAVWDKSQWLYNAHLAVDGVVAWASAAELGSLPETTAPLSIGGLYRSEGNTGQRLHGSIDNVTISVDRPELLKISGRPNPDIATPTGAHLLRQPGLLETNFVYADDPTPECHGGTLVQRPDGAILAAWFGGTREGHIDSGVWQSTLEGDNGWTQPRKVAHAIYPNQTLSATYNPVLFQYPEGGPALLFYLGGEYNMSFLQRSDDGGATWSEAQRLPGKIRGASKNKPVLLADGTLLCPDNSGNRMSFDRTRDFGETWLPTTYTPRSSTIDAIQPTILVHKDGRLQALARSKTGSIVESWSGDNGETWSEVAQTSLPNNYSGIDAVTLKDGRHLLIYNHSGIPEGRWGGPRTPLNIALSEDGVTWYAALVLEDEPGEFSYPVLIEDEDGIVHALYTWNRVRMKHAVIDPAALQLVEIKDGVWPQ